MGGKLTSCTSKQPTSCSTCACSDQDKTKAPKPALEKYPSKRKRKDIKKLQEEVNQKKSSLERVKSTAVDLSPKLSVRDAELVADQIRDLERRYEELEFNIRRKRQGYSSLGSDMDAIKEEADRYLAWLEQCEVDTREDSKLGHAVENVEKRLEKLKDLETELCQRQMTLDSVGQKAQALVADLPVQEKDNLENLLATVQSKHNELYGTVSDKCRILEEKLDQRKEFQERLDKLNKWLDERETACEPFDTIRLLAVHVEKQLDKCKSLGAKVQNQAERVNEIKSQAEILQQEFSEEEKQELDDKIQELEQKHQKLLQRVKGQQNNLRDCCSSRKSFEGDCQKIERWCKETEMQLQTELPHECAVEILEEQHQMLKNLNNSVQVFTSLVTETKEKGENFFPSLYEADKPLLEKQLEALEARFQGVSASVEEKIKNLGDMVDSRSQTRNQIESTEQWLREIQEELKQNNAPIGYTSQDAELILKVSESIEEKLESFQPSMNELANMGETLKAENQTSQAEDIRRLTALYNSLLEQAHQHTESVTMAITARKSFEQLMNNQEELVKEQDEVLNNIMNCNLPLSERVTTMKNILDCLQNQESELNVAKDKAVQIGKQGTENDFNTVVGKVDSLMNKVKHLKSKAQGLVGKCEDIQRGRSDFEAAVFDMVSWFEEKEEVLATCQPLHADASMVEPAIEKHKATSVEAVDKMQAIKDRMTLEAIAFEEIQEEPTPEFSEKMEQIKALEGTLLSAISKKELYLNESQADRKQYENSMKQVSDWLRGAETLLDSGYEGLDFDTLESSLSEFTDYFTEASLCQDEIEQVVELSERLLPTLDENDSATMKQSLSNVNRKFINVTAASQSKQAMMEQKAHQWKEFQRCLLELNAKLDVLESEWAEVEKSHDTTPDAVIAHLEMVKGFLTHAESSRPEVDNVNDLARELDRVANGPSRDVIRQRITALNQRWDGLLGDSENRISSLETIGNHWGDFATMMSAIKSVIQDSENKIRSINFDDVTHEELKSELANLKDIGENLEQVEPQIAKVQSSRLNLQQALPTAEAKISSQEEFMAVVEAHERLTQTVQSESDKVQEEYDERQTFISQIDKSMAWYQNIVDDIKNSQPGGLNEDMTDKLNKHRMLQHEVASQIDQNKRMEKTQDARYSALGKDVPTEMADKLAELHTLEETVLMALKDKEDELLHIKEDREDYRATLQKVIQWLQKADMRLQDTITDIPQAQQEHQALLLEFDEFKHDLDHLRNKGGDIIRHSSDPQEKQSVQKTLADINRQWLSLQAQAADKTQDLSEASDLSNAIDDVANSVTQWAVHAQAILDENLELTNFDKLKEQLKTYRKLRKEVDPNQDKVIALNAMVKQLEQVCSSPANMTKVGELKHTVATIETKSDVQLSALEEANKRMEEFEREVGDLMNWLEQTRARMTMRDTTRDLKDQLAVQEQLLDDVISNKARAEDVLANNPEAARGPYLNQSSVSTSGEPSGLTQAGHLMSEMNLLEESAREQRDSLKLAVSEQDKYESEIRQLNTAISEAQHKLLASPVMATSVGALKQQIAEHNTITPPLTAPRERSSSFGDDSGPVGRPLGQVQADDKIKDLNVSISTLQEQVINKERELQAALLRQERYQQTVQELTAKMERAYMKLNETPASIASPLEDQIAEYKETVAEIDGIRDDINKVKERGQLIVDTPNSEGHKAMEATLTMLTDRFNNLQALADDKGRQLQEALQDREKHEIAMKVYHSRVGDLKSWLEEARIRQINTGLLSEDPASLQTQLDENKKLQEQVNNRLQQLSDLALQCDALCENETAVKAERLRNDLANLQNQLGQFKMATIERQAKLRASIKEAEKRKREMDELDSSVQRLQKWMTDTKEMTKPSEHQEVIAPPTIHKDLATDLRQHKKLVRQLSKRGLRDKSSKPEVKPVTNKEISESWERLDKQLSQKTKTLEDLLRLNKPGELVKVSLYAPARQADSARQLQEVKHVLTDMGDCWNQLQVQLDEKQLHLDDALTFQQQYQSALENVSGWLDVCQQQVFTAPSTTEEHIRQNENLRKEIQSLLQQVASISEQGDDLVQSTGGANQPLIQSCLTSLNNRTKLLDETAEAQAEDLRNARREWKQYQAEVAELQQRLQDTQKLVLAPSSTQSLDKLMSNYQNIEAQLKKCEAQLKDLKQKETTLTEVYPKGVFPSELVTLQSNFMELQRRAQEKKASLQKSVSIQDQYLKMLKDYATFVDTAQDKLKHDVISARDLNHLKQQLSTHKDFFSDLEVHKAILDSLASQCDESTRRKHKAQHSSLSSLSYVLVDQASLRGQRLERLSRQWTELDEKYIILQKSLSSLEAQVPSPIASGDSLTTIQDKLSKYKRLQSELADERGSVFEVVDRGKQILHSVNCPTLEAAITDLADKWVSLNTDLTHELKRTETLGDQLSAFEAEAALFASWLKTAKMTCASFKQLTPSDVQSIGSIRTKVEKVLEFRKEVENQLPLKNRLLKVGNELLQNKNYDTRGLSDRLSSYEDEWSQLEKGISETEEFLHQAQMDQMPSRQALAELNNWLEEINKALKADAKKRINSVADIELMVKKYKGYKIELASKHMTLDFVNQDVLAPSLGETDVPHEKMEFAEKLGGLNKQWKEVVVAVDDRLNTLEGVKGKWEEYEQTHLRLQAWIKEQEDKITRYKLIGHEVGVKQTLRDCKSMQQQLESKQFDLDTVKTLGNNLIIETKEAPGCQQSVRDSLSSLDQNWKRLEEQTRMLENLLTDMLGQWARYHTDLASLTQVLTQTEYCLQQYTLVGGDISTLRSQVAKLKDLEKKLSQHSDYLDSFVTLAGQLQQVCEPPVQLDIQKTVADIQTRWKQLSADLSTRCRLFEQCLAQWEKYEARYNNILDWLKGKEQLCTDLITMRDDPSQRKESLAKSRELQGELDNIQSQLSDLYRLSDQLTKNMNPSTIAILTSRQSAIDQRLLALRQILSQHMATLKDDLSQLGHFNEAFEVVNNFLNYAASVLSPPDPTKAAEQEHIELRLNELKRLLSQFTSNMINLDHVNNLGYLLALNQYDATRLRELNHKWQDLHEDARERSRALQTNLLIQQDFTTKCEAWMTFLAQTEQDLATEIKTNLPGLKEQLKRCEQFESEIYSRQQILHAIISDGQKMMKAGEVEDRREFEQKLKLLADQWQSVLRRANERKAIIESVISQWEQFNSMSQQLMRWLKDKEAAMRAFEFDSTSLQSVRSLVEKVKTTEREFALQEASFKKIHDLGNNLLQRADSVSSEDIKDTLDRVQKSWFRVFSQLDEHRSRLEGVDRQWLECEEDIDDILNWLKDIRHFLHSELPNSYDELQAEITRCKDIASSFVNSEDRRQRLLSKEKQLSRVIQPDDLNLLHQRIRLLNKQWDELRQQTLIREQRLSDALYRWNNFGERLRSLLTWISDMEVKVVSNKDMHVEDLLIKLETDYKEEMREKEKEKNALISQGHTLMKISSEVRASDIEQKLLRLEDKWAHLAALMDFRQRKLQETVLAVKQLDVSMKNLTQWLSSVERELSSNIAYKDSGVREIHLKLHDTQELQRDIERHSPGVSSVLNLCEVLLHDSDACPTETEFSALQHAMKSLEKRWRNICGLCPQRRTRVEETWQLWETFREDCSKFSDWLTVTEKEMKDSETDISNIAVAKEEIRKYENLQRNVHDHLRDLEHINKQYRHLAKEGRTDTDGSLKVMMTELNNRWDLLQLRITEIMKKLRHSASIRQDFETTYTSLMTWLTEVDMQLTNLDSLESLDLETRISEIHRIEDEIQTKRHRMAYLDQAAIYLMQKGDSRDALQVQQQLDEFRNFSKSVFERVTTLKLKTDRMLVAQVDNYDSPDLAEDRYFPTVEDRLKEIKDAQTTESFARQTAELEAYLEISPPESPPFKRRLDSSPSRVSLPASHRTSSPVRRAGARLPRSSSPSPLRSSSPIRRSFSPTRRDLSPRGSPSPSRKGLEATDGDSSSIISSHMDVTQREKSAKIEILMEQLAESLDDANIKMARMEKALTTHDPDMERSMRLYVDCETAVDTVHRLDRLLKTETGLPVIASVDNQVTSVLDRWEQLKSRARDGNFRVSQDQHDLNQFNNDLDNILAWLAEAEALQASHQHLPADIAQLEVIVRQYKDFLAHLEAKKATVLSINLLSRNYLTSKREDAQQLKSKLHEMNRRWDQVLARAGDIQRDLQMALIQCQEFHRSINDYQLWLERIESQVRQCEPLNLNASEAALWSKYATLSELHNELQRNHPKIVTLKETADQLLLSTDSPEMSTARDKTHIINNRLRSLMHLTSAYISSLENKLKLKSKRGSASSSFEISEGRSSGLGSSYASRSSTPLRSGSAPMRSRARSPFAISRQFLKELFSPLLRSRSQDRDNLTSFPEREGDSPSVGTKVRPSLVTRVIGTALPIQLLLLLLLLLACLVPICEDEYNCLLSNNLRRSISPMLRYTDGPPPI